MKTCATNIPQNSLPYRRLERLSSLQESLQLELFPLPQKRQKSHQLLWGLSQAKEVSPYLQIASVPVNERIDPKELRYILVILPHGIRSAGGQYTAQEAHAIAKAVKNWDWSLDENQRPFCLPALEALLDSICKHAPLKGGKR